MAHLKLYNAAKDPRRERRALSEDEINRLIGAVAAEGMAVLGMAAPDRAMLYRLALGTGFRANELRTLTPAAFNHGAEPSVTVEAAYSKNRRKPASRSVPTWRTPYVYG